MTKKSNPCEPKERKVEQLEEESEKLERVGDCMAIDELGRPQSEVTYVCKLKNDQLNDAKLELDVCKKRNK